MNFAFIPVRGGSQSIPLKNIKNLAGQPLIFWTLKAAQDSKDIQKIFVATDHPEIARVSKSFGFSKLQMYHRSPENAGHQSSTESVMLEFLSSVQNGEFQKFDGFQPKKFEPHDQFVLIQATNPFLEASHLDSAIRQKLKNKTESVLSAVRTKRFFWSNDGKPINYDFNKRPRRQDFSGMYMENGAFYINSVGNILRDKNRLTGPVEIFEMPEESGFEIDEPADWVICEELLKFRQKERA